MNKAIILVNSRGILGGAEIRYLNLFRHICQGNNDYYLLINSKLLSSAFNKDLIIESDNIYIIDSKVSIDTQQKNKSAHIIKLATKSKDFIGKSTIRRIRNNYKYLKKVVLVYRALKKLHINYLYGVWEGGILAWPSKYILGFRFVYSYMDSGFSNIENKNLLNHEKLPLLFADKVDFLSKNLETYVVNKLKQKVKATSVTPCSFIDYTNYYPKYPKDNIVVFSARLTPIKNPIIFLEAIEIVNSTRMNLNIQYLILGDGELSNSLKGIIQKKNLSNVQMKGFVNNTYEYLQKSKVFISIQESNNYPSQSLLEAMACENAIIASDVGETRLLITEKEGILVDLNPKSIANAIIKLFNNNGLMSKFGANARQKAISEHTVEKYLEYFYSLEK